MKSGQTGITRKAYGPANLSARAGNDNRMETRGIGKLPRH